VISNAGAGGVSICDFLVDLKILTESGEEILLTRADLLYGYRAVDLPRGSVVLRGSLKLEYAEPIATEAALTAARTRRRDTQPLDQPSAGCIFKNPSPEKPAGAIIDRLGFKGMTVGGAQVSGVHANFIVNRGGASASDVLALIGEIRCRVKEQEHIDLELEIRVVGEESAYE
jgi:UDP-N-acetylmuramate dehydrogenase